MAISAPHYELLKRLYTRGHLPEGGRILEIGEANWYGDIEATKVFEDINTLCPKERRPELIAELERLCKNPEKYWQWDVVKLIYKMYVNPSHVRSIDFDGTPEAKKVNLNFRVLESHPIYSLVYNHGTAEHIFNIANVFRTMHDNCCVGGLMIHESPFTGWIDHGHYTLQPTLFYDVAAANHYEIVILAIEQITPYVVFEVERREKIHEMAAHNNLPANAMLFVALRKTLDTNFVIPMQGVYAKNVSDEVTEAWRTLR